MLKNIQKTLLKIILYKKCINEYCEENVEEFIKQIDNLKINIDSENYCAKIKCCFCFFYFYRIFDEKFQNWKKMDTIQFSTNIF